MQSSQLSTTYFTRLIRCDRLLDLEQSHQFLVQKKKFFKQKKTNNKQKNVEFNGFVVRNILGDQKEKKLFKMLNFIFVFNLKKKTEPKHFYLERLHSRTNNKLKN